MIFQVNPLLEVLLILISLNLLCLDGTVRTVTAPLVKSKRTFPQSGMAY